MADTTNTLPWRCFHCNETFTDAEQATLHFGSTQMSEPACQVSPERLRELEAQLDRYRHEDTDLHREIYGLHAKHHTALQREEEKGYARGLADARALLNAAPVEPVHIRYRWNIEPQSDGSMLICENNHEKGEKCEYLRYVPETQAAPLAPPSPSAAPVNRLTRDAIRQMTREASATGSEDELTGDDIERFAELVRALSAAPVEPIYMVRVRNCNDMAWVEHGREYAERVRGYPDQYEVRVLYAAPLSPSAAPVEPRSKEQEQQAFEARWKYLDFARRNDAWGREQYAHDHVQSLWAGWLSRSEDAAPLSPAPLEQQQPPCALEPVAPPCGKDSNAYCVCSRKAMLCDGVGPQPHPCALEPDAGSQPAITQAQEELLDAAATVVARWETPKWKDEAPTATFIYRLRDALAAMRETIALAPKGGA
jgi:hypothetical protein